MNGQYAQNLREQIKKGEINLEYAFRLMVDKHDVHPRIAARLLAEVWPERLPQENA
jgi:hypothetical protein